MTPVEKLLPQLENVRQTRPHQWMACCPAHDDRTPSLGVCESDDGKVVLNCLAGCSTADIISILGLAWTDLFPDHPTASRTRQPYWNSKDLLAVGKDEYMVLACGWGRLRRGDSLSDQDLERIDLARERIYKIFEVSNV